MEQGSSRDEIRGGFESPEAAVMSRGIFLKGGAAMLGAIAVDGMWGALPAFGTSSHDGSPGSQPKPIPGGLDDSFMPVTSDPLFHAFFPAIGQDMSTITDFKGVVAAAEIQGTASASNGSTFWFDADMRFMQGQYIATDGRLRERSFVFV